MYPNKVRTMIRPETTIPFRAFIPLMMEWIRVGFEPQLCRIGLERVLATTGLPTSMFRLEAFEDGGHFVTDDCLLPAPPQHWTLEFELLGERLWNAAPSLYSIFSSDEVELLSSTLRRCAPWFSVAHHAEDYSTMFREVPFDSRGAEQVARVFRVATHMKNLRAFRREAQVLGDALIRDLSTHPDEPTDRDWPKIDRPGIYRREHACLVIRSSTTTLLVDPICLWRRYTHLWRAPTNLDLPVDAIFVTHGHNDHFNIPSILHCARDPAVPVIVPQVPRVNVLTPFVMDEMLRSFGQKVVAPQWWSTMTVGDITVDVLPFFGEQPTRDAPVCHPAVRNWGNCYRFNTPEFSALLLVDSGTDPLGSMADVVRASTVRRGPPDVLLTSLPVFLSPFFGGLAGYFLSLPFYRLQELFAHLNAGHLASVTPGPDGIPKLCAESGARYYLPYGNGFEGVGVEISDVSGDGQPAEPLLVEGIAKRLYEQKVATVAMRWNPGDVAEFRGHALVLRKA